MVMPFHPLISYNVGPKINPWMINEPTREWLKSKNATRKFFMKRQISLVYTICFLHEGKTLHITRWRLRPASTIRPGAKASHVSDWQGLDNIESFHGKGGGSCGCLHCACGIAPRFWRLPQKSTRSRYVQHVPPTDA